MPIVPPIILFLSQHPLVVKYDLSSLHTLVSGAAPAGGDTLTRTQERLNNAKLVARQGLIQQLFIENEIVNSAWHVQ